MATLPKVLINRADYQIGGGVALRLRTQGGLDETQGGRNFTNFHRLRSELRKEATHVVFEWFFV
jgi:hypothetical protein